MAFTTKVTQQTFSDQQLDLDADLVMRSAYSFAERLKRAREYMDKTCMINEPLFVVLGETHTMPAHVLHHMIVLNELLQQDGEGVSVVRETSHDLLVDIVAQTQKLSKDKALVKTVTERDKELERVLSLKAGFTYTTYDTAHFAHKNLHATLLQRQFNSVAYGDASVLDGGILNMEDPSTFKAAHSVMQGRQALLSIDGNSRDGGNIRNRHMVTTMKDVADVDEARVVVLVCGSTHVAGNGVFTADYKGSVVNLLRDEGKVVLAHSPMCDRTPWRLPSDVDKKAYDKIVSGDFLPEWRASYHVDLKSKSSTPIYGELQCMKDEAHYLEELAERIGVSHILNSAAQLTEMADRCYDDLQPEFEALKRTLSPAKCKSEPGGTHNSAGSKDLLLAPIL